MTDAMSDKNRWLKLDNAAKVYPAMANPRKSCVFRLAVSLISDIRPEILQQAVKDCKPRFPSLYVRLRKGLFWHYFEANEKEPIIKPESPYINQYIEQINNNDYLFTVFYYQKRVSVELFHSLTDGMGAFEFVKTIIHRYFELQGCELDDEGLVLRIDQKPDKAEIEDSYLRNFTRTGRRRLKARKAYRIPGTRLSTPGDFAVIIGKIPLEPLTSLARENNASITQYLAAVLAYCIGQDEAFEKSDKPININLPVNLRKIFKSRTMRNFSLYFLATVECKDQDLSFESILKQIKAQFRQKLNKKNLQQNLNANVALEKNLVFRLCPLLIKNTALKIAGKLFGDGSTTSTISNGGVALFPQSMQSLVTEVTGTLAVSNKATHSICTIYHNDQLFITFSRAVIETEIERRFFTYLAAKGLKIEIQSNLRENMKER